MKVLVTGTTGCIGGAVADLLRQKDVTVIAVNRARNALTAGNAVYADFAADPEPPLLDVLRGCHAVVHAAADLTENPLRTDLIKVNTLAAQHLALQAHDAGVPVFLFFSTLSLLQRPLECPITENHPVAPRTLYALSKYLAEETLRAVAQHTGLRLVIFRISSPVGPGFRRTSFFAHCAERAYRHEPIPLRGQGQRRQDYVDARDIAHAVWAALTSPKAEGMYLIASGSPVSNYELAETCIRVLGSSSTIVFTGEPDPEEYTHWAISVERAQRELGFRPRYDLSDSVRDYIAWKFGSTE